jgi:hypothetical protein
MTTGEYVDATANTGSSGSTGSPAEQTANEIAYLGVLLANFNTLAAQGSSTNLHAMRDELMRRIETSLDLQDLGS